jgi:sterol desaturase/sphingolipid hydroxylase (fatty acid hydroxylase superfamily)
MEALLGFVPFILMYQYNVLVWDVKLPPTAPSLTEFMAQLAVCATVGDLCHWTHRLLHSIPLLRTRVHSVHHRHQGQLHSWVGMQVHPVEIFMITVAIYTPFLFIAHPLVLWCFAVCATANATVAHSGYDAHFFSAVIPFALTANDHQRHHQTKYPKNFGNILRIWDTVFGTYTN